MEDADLIACVYPFTDVRRQTSDAIRGSRLFQPPKLTMATYDRGERASTEPLDEPDAPAYYYLPSVEIRFHDPPRTRPGIFFGSDPSCDVVIARKDISPFHFSVTFDDTGRLIVRDCGSLLGTEVTYDEQGRGRRSNFQWIISGHRVPETKQTIVVWVNNVISFQIVTARQGFSSGANIDKVDRFRSSYRGSVGDLFRELEFQNRSGERRSKESQAPYTGDIYLKKQLGEGSFGVVTHCWDVSNGREFALKEPTVSAIRRRVVDDKVWIQEARIMSEISHDNIVKLLRADFTPYPQLYLEYAPCGTLDDQDHLKPNEAKSVLRQCLSALAYLHGRRPPIVHRDIKPGNILVYHRSSGGIHVKFGDFGLSRDRSELFTICGTRKYIAPEVYMRGQESSSRQGNSHGYSTAVDIWSVGVVVYELQCSLPTSDDGDGQLGVAWCDTVIKTFHNDLEKRPSQLKHLILSAMVVTRPEARLSAARCYEQALLLSGVDEDAQGAVSRQSRSATSQHRTNPSSKSSVHPSVAVRKRARDSGSSSSPSAGRYTKHPAREPDVSFRGSNREPALA